MDYIYTTNRQSGREKNGTMYNGGGLGCGDWSRLKVLSGLSKTFRKKKERFKDVLRDVRDFEEVRRASKGCPMTYTTR